MNKSKTMALCVVAALLMTGFGVFYGAHRGWSHEYAQVQALYSQENGLEQTLSLRLADGANLQVVALRHLPSTDSTVDSLQTACQNLKNAKTLTEKSKADTALTQAAASLTQALEKTKSFQDSTRDQNYISYLIREMETLNQRGGITEYNDAVASYNSRLTNSLSGRIARMMGVAKAVTYQQ